MWPSRMGNETYELPKATLELLQGMPRNVPIGANRMLVHGKHCCGPYVVRPSFSMLRCAAPAGASGGRVLPRTDC